MPIVVFVATAFSASSSRVIVVAVIVRGIRVATTYVEAAASGTPAVGAHTKNHCLKKFKGYFLV